MAASLRRGCFAVAIIASSGLLSAAASAQSLALSYALDLRFGSVQHSASFFDRCAGVSAATLAAEACNVPGWALLTPGANRKDAVVATATERAPTPSGDLATPRVDSSETSSASASASTAQQERPALGSAPPDPRMLRVAGGTEVLTGSARNVDLILRLGSKYRQKSGDENGQLYKFTDVAYESRLQNSAKAVALELVFPFQ